MITVNPTDVTSNQPSILLCGPPLTENRYQSCQWRLRALRLLKRINWQGTVYSPSGLHGAPIVQREFNAWRTTVLDQVNCLLFWIPPVPEISYYLTEFGAYSQIIGPRTHIVSGAHYLIQQQRPNIFEVLTLVGLPGIDEDKVSIPKSFAEAIRLAANSAQ